MFTKVDIGQYFITEKNISLLFVCIGIAAIILAIIFFFYVKTSLAKGFCIPFILIGLLHIIMGCYIYNGNNESYKQNIYMYDINIGKLKDKELPRIKKIHRNIVVHSYIELILLVVGLLLIILFINRPSQIFWTGFGIALAIEAAVTLSIGLFAEKRAVNYTKGLIESTGKPH